MNLHFKAILNSYSEIFFLRGTGIGILMLVATLINPNVSLAGILAVLSAYLFANLIDLDREFLKSGFYTYNPLLVGLSIGYLFQLNELTLFLVVTAGIFAFMVTKMMYSILAYYLKLPILSLPFAIISSIAYLASAQYSNLYVTGLYPSFFSDAELFLPVWISGLLKSLGAILFVPDVISGAVFLAVIFFTSRILFMLVVGGYYAGTLLTAMLVGSFQQAFTDLNHFNFILIAMALGGIFLIPSLKTYLMALIGVACSTMLLGSVEVFWASYGIPAFTLPFNVVSLTFIYVLGIVDYPLIAKYIKSTPEESLDYYLSTVQRFRGTDRTLSLPFSGQWTVWQGFEGRWTHQGSWKYAYDFLITDAEENTYRNEGGQLEDYYAFGKPVLSPVRGRVLKVINTLEDNPIHQVDRVNNWGNLVIIYDPRGFYVEISHFLKNSLKVKEGDWVEKGTVLGQCGNSGYSPQPHIHIQVQSSEALGSSTLPFSFVNYLTDNRFHSNDLPEEGEALQPLHPEKEIDLKTAFILDQEYRYAVEKAGQPLDELTLTVGMAPDGTFYFDSGRGKLYFGKHEGTFYFYQVEGNDPYLNAVFIALPRLPLAFREKLTWEDYVPVGTVVGGLRKAVILFLSSFYHDLDKIKIGCVYRERNHITGTVKGKFLKFSGATEVELDEFVGLKRIRFNDLELRRISE